MVSYQGLAFCVEVGPRCPIEFFSNLSFYDKVNSLFLLMLSDLRRAYPNDSDNTLEL